MLVTLDLDSDLFIDCHLNRLLVQIKKV